MTKLRAVILGDYPLNPHQIHGGVEAAFAYLVRELAQEDALELHVITLNPKAQAPAHVFTAEGACLHILPMFPRLEFARNFRNYQKMLGAALQEIQPHVIHAQGATDHAYVALRSGYPTVITVHGVQSEDSKHQGTLHQRSRKWLYSRLIERYNLSHTRHLIAISRYVTQYFARNLNAGTNIYFIPNAIDDRYFQLRGAGSSQTILYAGRLIRRKRALDLVEAFARVARVLPNVQLRLAGEFESEREYAAQVRAVIEREQLQARVHFLGALSEEAVLREFQDCALLALPSIQETSPMVIAQAMAAGKPVIATPVGGVPEMLVDDKTGLLVPVGDVTALSQALQRVLRDDALRMNLGRAARLHAQENFHARAVARKTYRAYAAMQEGYEPAKSHLYRRTA